MKKRKELLILAILIIILFAINYKTVDNFLIEFLDSREPGIVERIVDGDTIKINGNSVRLLGINTPERGEKYYEEAKDYLASLIDNKTVYLEYGKEKYDKYGRVLAYVYLDDENVNQKMIEQGYANYYFPSGRDKYYPHRR